MSESTAFQRKLEERRRKAAEEQAATDFTHDSDLIPENPYNKTPEDIELDRVVSSIDIVDGYRRFCGKMNPVVRQGQTEGIKISCPKPSHPDNDPSAWINTKDQVWFCGGCQEGGDIYDIAAYHFGYPVPGYKEGATFHELRRSMAEAYGYSFVTIPGKVEKVMVSPTAEPPPEAQEQESDIELSESGRPAVVEQLFEDDDIIFPTLDWRPIVVPGTFMYEYMQCTTIDDVPEEYHFWNGLIALGLAIGRDVSLYDQIPVYGNIFLCLMGHTGDGKSRSYSHLRRLLKAALPYKFDDETNKGAEIVQSAGSAESLIHHFSKPVMDPINPKMVAYYAPVRGLIEYNELSGLVGRTARVGNVIKPTLMDFYDASTTVSTSSMTHGRKVAEMPFASAFTTTQPRAFKDLIKRSDADSGFLNRWIFASGQAKTRVAVGGVSVDVGPAVKPLLEVHGWAGSGRVVQWDIEAIERFTDFYHAVLHPAQKRDDSGFLTRMDLTLKKLILLFAANQMLDVVHVDLVDAVLRMYPYLVSAYSIPAAQLGNTLAQEIQDELLRQIKRGTEKKSNGMTLREINLMIKRKKYPLDLVTKTLKYMTDLGMIEAVASKGAGRPTVRYRDVG